MPRRVSTGTELSLAGIPTSDERTRAAARVTVACNARSVDDARHLLDVLGLREEPTC